MIRRQLTVNLKERRLEVVFKVGANAYMMETVSSSTFVLKKSCFTNMQKLDDVDQ